MPNTRAGEVNPEGALPTFGADIAPSSGMSPVAAPVAAQALEQDFAAPRFGIAAQLGHMRDTIARQEGFNAGKVAGDDPNFTPNMDDETIRGEAFNQAASATYSNNLEAQTRQQINDAYTSYMGMPADQRDPATLQQNFAAIQKDAEKNHVFPSIMGQFQAGFSNLSLPYMKAAQNDLESRTQDNARAALITNSASIYDDANRVATLPGGPEIDAQLGQREADYGKMLDAQVQSGAISAAQAAQNKLNFQQNMIKTRAVSIFQNTPVEQQPAAFAAFQKAYGGGVGLANPQAGDPNAPLAQRNNNFTNIRDGGFAQGLPGYIGANGGFASFATPEDGLRAANANLDGYAKRGLNTVSKIVSAWSPPNENDTPTLIANMAKRIGVAPNAQLDMSDLAVRAKLVAGLVQQETGKTPFSASDVQGALTGNSTNGVSPDAYAFISGKMQAQMRQNAAQARATSAQALGVIGKAQKQVEGGYDPGQAAWAQLGQTYGASPLPQVRQAWQTADAVRNTLTGFQGMRPEQIEAQIATMQAQAGKTGFSPQQAVIQQAAQGYLKSYRTDLATNPLQRAARDGVIPGLTAIDPSSPQALANTLSARIPQAEAVAAHYGQPPQYFTPDERAALKSVSINGGPQMVQAAGAFAHAMGPKLDGALREIGGDAPVFANMARLAAAHGDPSLMADVGEQQRLNADPATKKLIALPATSRADAAFGAVVGDTLAAVPAAKAQALAFARAAYGLRAFKNNLDMNVVGGSNISDFAKVAQGSLGATYDGSTQYGGIGSASAPHWYSSNQKVWAPPDMRADSVGKAVDALTDKDFAGLPQPPVAGDLKTPVSASSIQGGHLVSKGPGVYWVALGDPKGQDPQWVMSPSGGKFTLDLPALEPRLRERVPGIYRGGGS